MINIQNKNACVCTYAYGGACLYLSATCLHQQWVRVYMCARARMRARVCTCTCVFVCVCVPLLRVCEWGVASEEGLLFNRPLLLLREASLTIAIGIFYCCNRPLYYCNRPLLLLFFVTGTSKRGMCGGPTQVNLIKRISGSVDQCFGFSRSLLNAFVGLFCVHS